MSSNIELDPVLLSEDCRLNLKVTSCGGIPLKGGTLILFTDRARKIKIDLNAKGEGDVNYCMLKHDFSTKIMKLAGRRKMRREKRGSEKRFELTEGLEYIQLSDSTYMYRGDTQQYFFGDDSKESIIKAKLVYRGYKLIGDHLSYRRYRSSFDMKQQLLKQFLRGEFRFEDGNLIFNLSICS